MEYMLVIENIIVMWKTINYSDGDDTNENCDNSDSKSEEIVL